MPIFAIYYSSVMILEIQRWGNLELLLVCQLFPKRYPKQNMIQTFISHLLSILSQCVSRSVFSIELRKSSTGRCLAAEHDPLNIMVTHMDGRYVKYQKYSRTVHIINSDRYLFFLAFSVVTMLTFFSMNTLKIPNWFEINVV